MKKINNTKRELTRPMQERYEKMQTSIKLRLEEFSAVPESKYFYELCYCILTPQSKAEHAMRVQRYLESIDFYQNPVNISGLLTNSNYLIRFHNVKAKRLIMAAKVYPKILDCLHSDLTPQEKRMQIREMIVGFGMKEASHFMRNIGYRGLGILDRHIIRYLIAEGVYPEAPKISTCSNYLKAEEKYLEFADEVGISVDELDILFWSAGSGIILK